MTDFSITKAGTFAYLGGVKSDRFELNTILVSVGFDGKDLQDGRCYGSWISVLDSIGGIYVRQSLLPRISDWLTL